MSAEDLTLPTEAQAPPVLAHVQALARPTGSRIGLWWALAAAITGALGLLLLGPKRRQDLIAKMKALPSYALPTGSRLLSPRQRQSMNTTTQSGIKQSVVNAWIPFNTAGLHWTDPRTGQTRSSPNEGIRIPSYMYEDILGLVTTGMGNLIENPATQPTQANPSTQGTITDEGLNAGWTHANGSLASPDEIRAEFANIKRAWTAGKWYGLGGFNANGRSIATLWLPDTAVKRLIFSKLAAFASNLKAQFPAWDSFPADAQMALLSMSWAKGSSFQGWPKFKAAVNASPPSWLNASAESYIYGPNHSIISAIIPRNDANARMFANADGVDKQGRDPSVLYFPADVSLQGIA